MLWVGHGNGAAGIFQARMKQIAALKYLIILKFIIMALRYGDLLLNIPTYLPSHLPTYVPACLTTYLPT